MSDDEQDIRLRLRLWLERDGQPYIGIGTTLLLQKIENLGSLRKAAESLGMSYRTAWGKMKKAEQRMGQSLVCKTEGKGQRFELSDFGREILERFHTFYVDVEKYAQSRAREIMKMDVRPHHDFYDD